MTEVRVDWSENDIRDWLVGKVGDYVTTDEQVRPDQPLAAYGLDSVFALGLCGDIEDTFGIAVEPTLAWDYPTINQITGFVAAELRRGGDPSPAGPRP